MGESGDEGSDAESPADASPPATPSASSPDMSPRGSSRAATADEPSADAPDVKVGPDIAQGCNIGNAQNRIMTRQTFPDDGPYATSRAGQQNAIWFKI